MRIIDKTPLQNEKGELSLSARAQAMLRYGFGWFRELEAQQFVIARLGRQLERGFVLIRNFTLPNSEIIIPLALLGPGGIQVLYASPVRGFFTAHGGDWSVGHGTYARAVRPNLLMRVVTLARAFQVYLQRQNITLISMVEPVLITADPGAHIEQSRPICRVVQSDAIGAFVQSILQAPPVFDTSVLHDMADRIVNPRPAAELSPIVAGGQAEPAPRSRAQAIFEATESAPPLNPSELSFAFEDEAQRPMELPADLQESSPAQPITPGVAERLRVAANLTMRQLLFLGFLAAVEVCILAGFAALVFVNR